MIERALTILQQELEISDDQINKQRLLQTLKFLLECGDGVHNVKEENHLFPMLVERGMSQKGLIHDMIMEHESEREQLLRWQNNLMESPLDDHTFAILRKKISDYIRYRQDHIQREESMLYTQASERLDLEDTEKLQHSMEQVDTKTLGESSTTIFSRRLKAIEKRITPIPFHRNLTLEETLANFHSDRCRVLVFDQQDLLVGSSDPEKNTLVGSSLQEVIDSRVYSTLKPHIDEFKKNPSPPVAFSHSLDQATQWIQCIPIRNPRGTYQGSLVMISDLSSFNPINTH
jgi:hypothetical protein